jgi:hypothetical protein
MIEVILNDRLGKKVGGTSARRRLHCVIASADDMGTPTRIPSNRIPFNRRPGPRQVQ